MPASYNCKMAFFMRLLRGSQNRNAQQRTQRLEREAVRKREDPAMYQVKIKLKNHPDPKYSQMSDEDMTKEAVRLTDQEALKEFFRELTHQPIDTIMEEVAADRHLESDDSYEVVRQKHLDRVGQLTLKLHLSHFDETPSNLARLGAALLKIPYGVLHAALEIGDTSNPDISYMVEFNESNLVQPRKKSLLEASALEATIALGGSRVKLKENWPKPVTSAEVKLREKRCKMKTGIGVVDSYYGAEHVPIRPRSVCLTSRARKRASTVHGDMAFRIPKNEFAREKEVASTLPSPSKCMAKQYLPQSSDLKIATNLSPNPEPANTKMSYTEEFRPNLGASPLHQPITTPSHTSLVSGEDLTPFVQMSLSKVLLVEKLVKIIIKYNKNYYYHKITRNCQTFITEVLQSFGVWENFKLGERLEVYLANLNKGRREVYKSHKPVNDRVRYLVTSGEIEETTYDEMRYLRSLYTIYHAEEFRASARPITAVCSEPDCMLNVLEENLKKKRPDGATRLLAPENYM